ncbi:MAG TPA: ATP synthase F1 subunit epsilon [Patescibacteria group bacterium]|nr:ATP synthase F1 subunit epsilon [Patescibacteria group bacterium]
MNSIQFELTTPERVVVKTTYDSITIPTQEGEITVLPGHIPLVANLAPGVLTVRKGNDEEYLAVSGGFIEFQQGDRLIVLADTAERAEELDLKKIEEAKERAQKLLTEKRHAEDISSVSAVAALERELARIKVIQRHRGSRRSGTTPGSQQR